MLAPKDLPENFNNWNQKHKAPKGALWWYKYINSNITGNNLTWRNRFKLPDWLIREIGAFGFQINSQSRVFEYPWCFIATALSPGMQVVTFSYIKSKIMM
ncbi:MAG: hypothetical protein QNJ74_16670 [Trichodesmium sp. MO_231.B1]|nr:hypothetical protein [Trichodesmium sp. MO_231.B1]